MGSGEHLDRLGQLAIGRDVAVLVAIGPDQIGQHAARRPGRSWRRRGVAVAVAADANGLIAYTW